MESHGGHIRLDSVVGTGITVVLDLPIWEEATGPREQGRCQPAVDALIAGDAHAYSHKAALIKASPEIST